MKSKFARFGLFVGTLGLSAGLVGAAAQTTGAYFSDTKTGAVTGTVGSIKVATGNTALAFTNLLPGEAQTQTVDYANSGKNVQDVWVVFDTTALHALNNLGTFGEVHIANAANELFASQNLNDNIVSCVPGTGSPACNAVPTQLKLSDSLAPGTGGTFKFTFMMGSKFTFNDSSVPFNCYPLGTCTSNGLPYKLVAVQHGQLPA
jgi:hypothetical protein